MTYQNGHSNKSLPPIETDSILLHLVASTARLEVNVDHIKMRLEKVEDRPEPQRQRQLSDYMPVIYGLALLAAVATGKLTVLQGLTMLKGG